MAGFWSGELVPPTTYSTPEFQVPESCPGFAFLRARQPRGQQGGKSGGWVRKHCPSPPPGAGVPLPFSLWGPQAAAAAAGLQRAVAEERQQREAADRRSAEAEAALAAAEAEGAALRGRLAAAQQACRGGYAWGACWRRCTRVCDLVPGWTEGSGPETHDHLVTGRPSPWGWG